MPPPPTDLYRPPSSPLFLEKIRLFARAMGDRPALIYNGKMMSFAALLSAASNLAQKFELSGLSASDLVGVFCQDKAKQIVSNLGLLLAGIPIISVAKNSVEIALQLGMTTVVSDVEDFLPSRPFFRL